MNVLSCFDGLSCGRIALERLGYKVDKYFASEINKQAIKVSKANYPDIIQLGDVTKISVVKTFLDYWIYDKETKDKLHNIGNGIDLLIGGSPCQGFSYAGNKLNFDDERSKLFFEYVRLLKESKPKYFLLENVKMVQEWQDVISEYLGVKPILINSSLVSAANRERLYWTNIPVMFHPIDKGILVKDIVGFTSSIPTLEETIDEIKKYTSREFNVSISKTGRIRPHRLDSRKSGISEIGTLVNPNDKCVTIIASHAPKTYRTNPFEIYELNRNECEKLQNVPVGYTDAVSENQAKKMLGNGWTVSVIEHILSYLPKEKHKI